MGSWITKRTLGENSGNVNNLRPPINNNVSVHVNCKKCTILMLDVNNSKN